MEESVPQLSNINLPNEWVLYLYDKQLFKKMANRANFSAKPHKEICTLKTVNDIVYILQLLKAKNSPKSKTDFVDESKINLDANDYIIMRKGIEPIWEDPKNSNGGTFTIKMSHDKGYDVWSAFIMYMVGETMTFDMNSINGITVSYISDSYNFNNQQNNNTTNNNYTYIKIWDGYQNRTRDQFINILPLDLFNKIKTESLLYTPNKKKKDFNEKNIVSKLNSNNNRSKRPERGGFTSFKKRN